jgi:3-oxoacyl-[acyl-carrier protein] reductase
MPKVFITGGARRLGRGLALEYAKAGWDVAFSYFRSEDKAGKTLFDLQQYGKNFYSFRADVRSYEQMQSGFIQMIDSFGVPDVLINNAAMFPKKSNLKQLDINDWHNVLDTNLNSVFYTSKIFADYAKSGAKIINIASIGAYEIWDGRIAYHVSKAAVIQLTKALARDLAPDMAVNSLSPGTIEMEGEPDGSTVPKINIDKTPMKRNARIDDVFKACLFLSTDENFITGTDIVVDGGYSLKR